MIEVKDLMFTYPGGRDWTLKGLEFTGEKGGILGFLGPSGAGKSTTQKILIGILKGYQGQVRIMGKELRQVKNDYYEKIGVAFEFPNLYNKFTALENLNFFKSMYSVATEDPLDLLDLAGLKDDARTVVANFSKGMKVRLNFCRALLNKPEILFLDEPTSGLDPVNAKNIKDIILQQKSRGTTIFLTTHNMQVAGEVCDQVAFMIDGGIRLIDSPRNLKIQHGKRVVRVEYGENGHLRAEEFDLKGIGGNPQFSKLLREKEIETMHTQEATLEDIFIKLTGRSLT